MLIPENDIQLWSTAMRRLICLSFVRFVKWSSTFGSCLLGSELMMGQLRIYYEYELGNGQIQEHKYSITY